MRVKFLAILLLLSIAGCTKESDGQRYYSSWDNEPNVALSKLLVKNNIHGCGEYYYQSAKNADTEYLIACTADGQSWNYYLLFTASEEVKSYNPDSSITPPARN